MGRYLSPILKDDTSGLLDRLTADEGDIADLKSSLAGLQTTDQQLQSAIDAINDAPKPYTMVAPILNNSIWTSGVYAGRTYTLPNNTMVAPAAGWVVNQVTSVFGSCAAAEVNLKINNVLIPFNGGKQSGWGPTLWDVRAVTSGQTITSTAYIHVYNTCGISYMSFSLSNFTFFIPSGQ